MSITPRYISDPDFTFDVLRGLAQYTGSRFIRDLAEYERLAGSVVATEEQLRASLFGEKQYAEVLIGEEDGRPVAFALFFHNYSTFLAQPDAGGHVGIIGCGEVSQIIHLPTLYQLNERFTVTALCDVSATVLNAAGAPLLAMPARDAMGMLSLVLAFMNFLPIPMLDGGYIMFILWEMITGKKVSDKVIYYANNVGLFIILGLMIYANTDWLRN